jgi:hypothetical protein
MNLQVINIKDGKVVSYTSPDFPNISEDKLEEFFDWCGECNADPQTFWSSDMSQNDNTIVIDFAQWPKDPQRIISIMAAKLGVDIAPFADWFYTE